MKKEYRYAFYLICAVQLIFAVGFSWQLPLAVNVWSLPDIPPLPYLIVVTYRVCWQFIICSPKYLPMSGLKRELDDTCNP